jgi:hypothetical protein
MRLPVKIKWNWRQWHDNHLDIQIFSNEYCTVLISTDTPYFDNWTCGVTGVDGLRWWSPSQVLFFIYCVCVCVLFVGYYVSRLILITSSYCLRLSPRALRSTLSKPSHGPLWAHCGLIGQRIHSQSNRQWNVTLRSVLSCGCIRWRSHSLSLTITLRILRSVGANPSPIHCVADQRSCTLRAMHRDVTDEKRPFISINKVDTKWYGVMYFVASRLSNVRTRLKHRRSK